MIDSHCHLDSRKYTVDTAVLLENATKAGIDLVINNGADIQSSENSVNLAQKYPMVFATVGIHPHDATALDEKAVDRLRFLAKNEKVKAIGEIGLDYYRDLSPRPVQKKAFARQLELAVELKYPIVIHTREAFDDTLSILKEYAPHLPGGVFHCFPGNTDQAWQVIDIGFVIAVGGVITYPGSQMSRTATEIPLEKIILETDAPYITPVPHRGKINEPAYVKFVFEKLAQLKGISLSEVEKVTDRTCKKVFRLVETFGG
jgi:TatD DNase family protein